MTKLVKLPISIEIKEYTNQKVLKIDFGNQPITDWCLSLCLLKENLIDSIVISNNLFSVEIQKDKQIPAPNRAQVAWTSDSKMISITETELDYWVAFFLKYHRDGIAVVDHIDVEISPAHLGDKETNIMLKVANALPPISAQEARQRLGL
jgi:hypothetical protein